MEKTEIISNKNKYNLWDDFNEKGYFNNIINEDFNNVQNIFEESIQIIEKKYKNMEKYNINSVNNEIESVFKKKMSIYDEQKKADKIQNHKIDNFNKLVENKQNEFDSLMKTTKPPDIDFANKVDDEPFKENIDDIINKTLQERQNEINEIVSSMPKPNVDNENSNETQIVLDDNTIKVNNFQQDNSNTNNNINEQILKSQILMIELLQNINTKNDLLEQILNEINIIKKDIDFIKNIKKKIKNKK
tara:strand:+ start:1048 stop:1785 length:738 start_codon:yes stop_codon:yes gene_type:complete